MGGRRLLLGVVRIVLLLLRRLMLRGMMMTVIGRRGMAVLLRRDGGGVLLLRYRLHYQSLRQLLSDHGTAKQHRHNPHCLHHLQIGGGEEDHRDA